MKKSTQIVIGSTILVVILVIAADLAYTLWFKKDQTPDPINRVTEQSLDNDLATDNDNQPRTKSAVLNIEKGITQIKQGDAQWQLARDGQVVFEGDWIRTGTDSAATLIFKGNHVMRLDEDTQIYVEVMSLGEESDNQILIKQLVGNTWSRVQKLLDRPVKYQVESKTVLATVRGTKFNFNVSEDNDTLVDVLDSTVNVAALDYDEAKNAKNILKEIDVQAGNRIQMDDEWLADFNSYETRFTYYNIPNDSYNQNWYLTNNLKDEMYDQYFTLPEGAYGYIDMDENFYLDNWSEFDPILPAEGEAIDELTLMQMQLYLLENDLYSQDDYQQFYDDLIYLQDNPDDWDHFWTDYDPYYDEIIEYQDENYDYNYDDELDYWIDEYNPEDYEWIYETDDYLYLDDYNNYLPHSTSQPTKTNNPFEPNGNIIDEQPYEDSITADEVIEPESVPMDSIEDYLYVEPETETVPEPEINDNTYIEPDFAPQPEPKPDANIIQPIDPTYNIDPNLNEPIINDPIYLEPVIEQPVLN